MAFVAVKAPGTGVMATPPATQLKRKRVEPESSGTNERNTFSESLSSPTKRLKVSFNPEIDVRLVEDWNEKSIGLVREEVIRAIHGHITGEGSTAYDQIIQLFKRKISAGDPPTSRLLRKYLIALTGQIRSLNRKCNGLVRAVVECQWLDRGDDFVKTYVRFLGTLVSAHGGYIYEVLSTLVKQFTSLPLSTRDDDDDEPNDRPLLFERIHQALKYLLDLIPSAPATLFKVLSDSFPYPTSSKQAHVDFVSNLLRIPSYAREMRNAMLGLAIDRVVKIDVQLQVDTEDLQEEYEEIMNHIMRKRQQQLQQEDLGDDMDESDDSDEDSEDNLELDPNQKRTLELKESVSKLDELMDLLFRFYNPIFAKGSSWDVNEVFDHMMTQFTHTILPVFQSRYTQFLVFHCAQSNPQLIDQFVSTCIRILTEKTRPDYIRLAASSYLASFVSRANRCSAATVRYVVDFLCQSLESDRELHETKDSVPDPHRFPAYYFTAQAIIYIFCFRWRVFMDLEEEDGDEFIENVVMGYEVPRFVPHIRQIIQRNIGCRLNPLKVCAPEIVDQFDRISSALKFTMATPIIASNKRLRISRPTVEAIAGYSARESAMSGGLNGMLQLEAFFPFDPYHLPQSVDWLKEDYNAWSPPPGMKHDFEDADEEDQRDTSEERNYRDNSLGLAEEEYEEDAGSESDVSA